MKKQYFDKKESATYLGCSEKELEKISVNGFLKSFKIGKSLIRYRRHDLRYFLIIKMRERDD